MEWKESKLNSSTPLRTTARMQVPKPEHTEKNGANKQKHSVMKQVLEAVEIVGTKRKGASIQAIKKWVLSQHEESTHTRLNKLVNKAILKGVETGALVRPTAQKNFTGARGYFMASQEETKPKTARKGTDAVKRPAALEQQDADSKVGTQKPRMDLTLPIVKVAAKQKGNRLKETAEAAAVQNKETKPKGIKTGKAAMTDKKAKTGKKGTTEKTDVKKGRKDASDSEVEVKKKVRKSLKAYSSDTEVASMATTKKIKSKSNNQAADKEAKSQGLKPSAKGRKKLFKNKSDVSEGRKVAGEKKSKLPRT